MALTVGLSLPCDHWDKEYLSLLLLSSISQVVQYRS